MPVLRKNLQKQAKQHTCKGGASTETGNHLPGHTRILLAAAADDQTCQCQQGEHGGGGFGTKPFFHRAVNLIPPHLKKHLKHTKNIGYEKNIKNARLSHSQCDDEFKNCATIRKSAICTKEAPCTGCSTNNQSANSTKFGLVPRNSQYASAVEQVSGKAWSGNCRAPLPSAALFPINPDTFRFAPGRVSYTQD